MQGVWSLVRHGEAGRRIKLMDRTDTAMTNPTNLDEQVDDYRKLVRHAGSLSVDLVLRMATLAASHQRLRMTLERSMGNVYANGQGFDDRGKSGP